MMPIPWEEIQKNIDKPDKEYSEVLNQWCQSDPENAKILQEIKDLNAISWTFPDYYKPDKQKAWEKVSARTKKKKGARAFLRNSLRIAASILFLVSTTLSTIFLFDHYNNRLSYNEVFSPHGHKTMVILPDSSKVWLNGNSRLRYNQDFLKRREANISGEALFIVKKRNGENFCVNSNLLKAEVYGTTFNYKDYNGDNKAEIALVEGSVGVIKDNRFIYTLKPDEIIVFDNQTRKFEVSKGNMATVTSWCSSELVIDNQPFSEVMKYLERWYGVEITLADNLNIEQKLSFKVKTESLQELLLAISNICPIKYKIDGKTVLISAKK